MNILFVCLASATRSQMAECLALPAGEGLASFRGPCDEIRRRLELQQHLDSAAG